LWCGREDILYSMGSNTVSGRWNNVLILFRRLIHRLKYQNAICFLYAIRNSIWDSIFLYNSKNCCNSDPIDLQYMYMHVQCLLFFKMSGAIKYSVTCDRSVVFTGSSGFLHQYN
jgi:hypothetical protein